MKEPKRRDMHNGPEPKEVKKYPLDHPMDSMRPPQESSIEIIKSKCCKQQQCEKESEE